MKINVWPVKAMHVMVESFGNISIQILNSMASRVLLLYPHHNGLIMCFSIKLLAFWILFQFSRVLVTQSRTICLQVKVVSLNLQRHHFQSSTAIQRHIIRNMKHFLLLLLILLHYPHNVFSPMQPLQWLHFGRFSYEKEKKHLLRCYLPAPHLQTEHKGTHKVKNK